MHLLSLILATTLATSAYARTDLEGCVSSKTRNQWNEASMIWYIPDTGEICDIPDCGGGRAPPKYDNPACPDLYTGTATYEPSYLPGYGPGAVASTSTLAATVSATTTAAGDSTTTTEEASGVTAATSNVVILSGTKVVQTALDASSTAESASESGQTQTTGGSSAVASGTSGSAGAQETDNGTDMLKWNGVGAVAAVVLAVVAL